MKVKNKNKILGELQSLIDKYKEYKEEERKNGEKLSEADVRKDLIDPFFKALGWKVRDHREYDAEKYVRGEGYVDIAIQVDRKPKIFIEAKKFGKIVSLKERGGQRDLRGNLLPSDWTDEERKVLNYAAKNRIKWAVLTNFEKFRLFNAFNGITIIDIERPGEYLERAEDLLYISKNAVVSGKIDDLERREERRDVDKNFLAVMKKWRYLLAQNIYSKNPGLSMEEVKEAVQRILDRFIIVRCAEDRLILDSPDLLKDAYEYWEKHREFCSFFDMLFGSNMIFHSFDKTYNSKIFERGHICEKVKVDDEVLESIIENLYNVNFRKFSSDILGRTYELYLGEILRISGEELEVCSSMEKRKAGGIYFTPQYVVDYIVGCTLKKQIEPIWSETLGLIREGNYRRAEESFKRVSEIKVLDPAVGSGSFLIAAFAGFKEYYEKYNEELKKAQEKMKRETQDGLDVYGRLPHVIENYPQKILRENIYGVDVDPQAAEICAVNLMLGALKRGEKLPLILEENIKTGNSLTSTPLRKEDLEPYRSEVEKMISLRKKLKELVNEDEKKTTATKEAALREKIASALNTKLGVSKKLSKAKTFFWEIESPEVFFNDDGTRKKRAGFNCIVSNPPDGAEFSAEEKKFIKSRFKCVGSNNSAEYFLEQSYNLTATGGSVGMIVPKSIAFYASWENIRSLILENTAVTNLMDVGIGFDVVNYEELIIVFKKGGRKGRPRCTPHIH